MREQLLPVLGEVRIHCSKELPSQCFVKWTARDGKGQRLNHVLHEDQVGHVVENRSKFHEYLLWLDARAQAVDYLIYFLLIEFLLVHIYALYHGSIV